MANDVKHIFMGLVAIHVSFCGEASVQVLSQLVTGLFAFLLLDFERSFSILDTVPLSDM